MAAKRSSRPRWPSSPPALAYDGFHKAMFALPGPIDDQKTLQVAQSVGLSADEVRAELWDRSIASELRCNLAQGS